MTWLTADEAVRSKLTAEFRYRADEAALARLPALLLAWDAFVEGSTSPVDNAFRMFEFADHMNLLRGSWRGGALGDDAGEIADAREEEDR